MIYEIKEDELNKLNGSFIDINYLKNEFKNNPYAKLLIYEESQKIIGFLYYSEIYERVEINQIEIDFFLRNRGKGDKLLKHLIKFVKKGITLEVKKDNFPAIRLYEKNGFEKKAIRPGYYNGTDGILMEREENAY